MNERGVCCLLTGTNVIIVEEGAGSREGWIHGEHMNGKWKV